LWIIECGKPEVSEEDKLDPVGLDLPVKLQKLSRFHLTYFGISHFSGKAKKKKKMRNSCK